MGINNRYTFDVTDRSSALYGRHVYQTQSVSGNFTGAQTDPSSYRGPAAGEMWELLQVRVYCSIALDASILLTDEDGIEYGRLSMTNESPSALGAGDTLSWNAGAGTVLVLPTWRLYAKWYGDPVAVGAWNWQYTARIHAVENLEDDGTVLYIP